MKKIFYSLMAAVVAAFTFASCEDVPMPYDQPGTGGGSEEKTVVEPTGSGTAADPYNIAALNEFAQSIESGASSESQVYFRGKIVSIKEITDASSYGNATFYISDDGTSTDQFYVYRCYGLNNQKFTSTDAIQEGDEVVVCGTITNYNGTLETATGKAYVVSINGNGTAVDSGNTGGGSTSTATASGTGTATDPYNVAAAMNLAGGLQKSSTSASYLSDEVYVKGKIVSVTDTEISSYGNLTYYISDDGTSSNQLEVYRGYGIDGAKFTSITDIKAGDEVVVYGKLQNWLGTYEFTSGSKLVSINGGGSTGDNTGGNTGEETGGTTSGTSEGISISGTTLTLTNSSSTASDETITIDLSTLGYENSATVSTVSLSDGTTIVFDANGETNGPKYYTATNGVRVYKNNTITFNGKAAIAKIEMTCDSYSGTNYVGNETATVSFSGKNAVYTNVFTGTSGGGVQLRVKTITITYAK